MPGAETGKQRGDRTIAWAVQDRIRRSVVKFLALGLLGISVSEFDQYPILSAAPATAGESLYGRGDDRGNLKVVPDEVIVRFRRGLPEAEKKALIRKAGATVERRLKAGDHHVLRLPQGASLEEALKWFKGRPEVEYVGPNHLIPVQEVPNDPRYAEQWALQKIQAASAWDLSHGSPEIVVAVIDTGVDYEHPDLSSNIWKNVGEKPNNGKDDDRNGYKDDVTGWDFVRAAPDCADTDCMNEDNDPMDGHGHGTHVAGIVGGLTNNGVGISGVSWDCKIMVLRAGYKNTAGTGILMESAAANAIEYAAKSGAKILNLSWGDTTAYPAIEDAIDFASDFGVLICAAAGNSGNATPFYPAAYPNEAMIAVGSTTSADKKASTSNYGDWVHIFAPGEGILSTCLSNTYCLKSGTSMAAPHVAGLAALLFSSYPGWSPALIKAMIVESADFLSGLQIGSTSAGRMNLLSSVAMDAEDVARFAEFFSASYGRMDCENGPFCDGDIDQDGDVDGQDLAGLAGGLLSADPP